MFISARDLKDLRNDLSETKKALYALEMDLNNIATVLGLVWIPAEKAKWTKVAIKEKVGQK